MVWEIDKYREEHESDDHWQLRRAFMENWKNNYSEERLVCLAQVFANVEFMGCRYPQEVMQEVSRLSQEVLKYYWNGRKMKGQRAFVSASNAAKDDAKGIKRKYRVIVDGSLQKSRRIDLVNQEGSDSKKTSDDDELEPTDRQGYTQNHRQTDTIFKAASSDSLFPTIRAASSDASTRYSAASSHLPYTHKAMATTALYQGRPAQMKWTLSSAPNRKKHKHTKPQPVNESNATRTAEVPEISEGLPKRRKYRGQRAGKLGAEKKANLLSKRGTGSNGEALRKNELRVAVMTDPYKDLTAEQATRIRKTLELMLKEGPLSPKTLSQTARVRFRGKAYYADGVLKMWGEDDVALVWLHRAVETIQSPIAGTKLVVRPQAMIHRSIVCGLFVPDTHDINIDDIIKVLTMQNRTVRVNSWSIVRFEKQMRWEKPCVYFLFRVPVRDVETLKQQERRMFWMLGSIYLRIFEKVSKTGSESAQTPDAEVEALSMASID